MFHDKIRAFIQKAQQDNTSYRQARLQRGQTEGRNFALYTRKTSSQYQQSQYWPITKPDLTFPVVFRKAAHFFMYIIILYAPLNTVIWMVKHMLLSAYRIHK